MRDVTATVESLDLITASILSKKLAAGLEGLVLDVKVGSAAFMKTDADARALAEALVSTANAAGCPTTALVTDMDQPIASAIGNALEVDAAMRVLTGRSEGALFDLTLALGGALLDGAGIAGGEDKLCEALASGAAAELMGRMVFGLGGPRDFVEDWSRYLPEANVIREVPAPDTGHVAAIDGEALGLAVVRLGGGRAVETDMIDPGVGLSDVLRLGAAVERGQPLARVHAGREDQADEAVRVVRDAFRIGEAATAGPLVRARIG